jgi:hypothetical protein
MSEYIDKSALTNKLKSSGAIGDFALYILGNFPTADVAPVVHAYWKGYHTQDPCCSNCGFSYDREEGEYAQTTDYCGNCGAKMDENEVENLKHCSCGDRHYCPEVEKDENGKWFIRCHMCHKIVRGNTIEEAVNAWNRRADTNDP